MHFFFLHFKIQSLNYTHYLISQALKTKPKIYEFSVLIFHVVLHQHMLCILRVLKSHSLADTYAKRNCLKVPD